jgi:hypothetical protein
LASTLSRRRMSLTLTSHPHRRAAMQVNAATGVSIPQYVVDGALEILVHETPISPRTMRAKYGSAGSRPNNGPCPCPWPLAGTLPTALLFASTIRSRHHFSRVPRSVEPGQSSFMEPALPNLISETAHSGPQGFDVGVPVTQPGSRPPPTRRIPTPRGGRWYAMSVRNALARS